MAPLTSTDGHRFWDGSLRQWIPASAMDSGAVLDTAFGDLEVAGTHEFRSEVPVFNLAVTGPHTYLGGIAM